MTSCSSIKPSEVPAKIKTFCQNHPKASIAIAVATIVAWAGTGAFIVGGLTLAGTAVGAPTFMIAMLGSLTTAGGGTLIAVGTTGIIAGTTTTVVALVIVSRGNNKDKSSRLFSSIVDNVDMEKMATSTLAKGSKSSQIRFLKAKGESDLKKQITGLYQGQVTNANHEKYWKAKAVIKYTSPTDSKTCYIAIECSIEIWKKTRSRLVLDLDIFYDIWTTQEGAIQGLKNDKLQFYANPLREDDTRSLENTLFPTIKRCLDTY